MSKNNSWLFHSDPGPITRLQKAPCRPALLEISAHRGSSSFQNTACSTLGTESKAGMEPRAGRDQQGWWRGNGSEQKASTRLAPPS